MFLTSTRRGYRDDGSQVYHGLFLVVACDPSHEGLRPNLRCIVRHARLVQCGHWIMGSIQIGPYRICISGDYGGDGLPNNLRDGQEGAYSHMHEIPAEIQEAFWSDNGWNSAGSNGPTIRKWAQDNIDRLRKTLPTEVSK